MSSSRLSSQRSICWVSSSSSLSRASVPSQSARMRTCTLWLYSSRSIRELIWSMGMSGTLISFAR